MEPTQPQPASNAAPQPEPAMALPPSSPPPKDKKSLVVALIAAALLLIASAAVAFWMFTKDAGAPAPGQPERQTLQVKKVTFVAPENMPSSFQKREQNTDTEQTAYYLDAATSCGITASVLPLNEKNGMNPKDVIVNSVKAAEAYGVKTTDTKDGKTMSLKTSDGKSVTFNTLDLTQDVAVEGVDFKKQYNTIAYAKVGENAVSIGYSCKDASWPAENAKLRGVAESFQLKTEN